MPMRQLSDLPKDELDHLAEEYGLDSTDFKSRQHLVTAIHERRQMIASMDREAMLDVIKWGRRPVTVNATKEQIAQEIARIRSMKFAGLSHRGLMVLAKMRGLTAIPEDTVPVLIRRLKKQEGIFSRMNRKRRAVIGSMVSRMLGEEPPAADYQFLPPQPGASPVVTQSAPPPPGTIKDEIEESGLFGGIAGRIKKSADSYVNQKLDEIESRIDRKLDEIDRRLAEWRDKEVANRIRILKITLWASVIVGAMSLVYSYVKLYIWPHS
jgi:predicted transcriptional regulator